MSRHGDASPAAAAGGVSDNQWLTLVGKVGADIAEPLTGALEQIHALISGATPDPSNLRRLRAAIEQARQVGMAAQQVTRFASRRIRVSHERLQLDAMLLDVLQHRSREAVVRGLAMSTDQASLAQAEVLADASLLFALLNTMVDWVLRHAQDQLRFSVDIRTWPANARLRCSFSTGDADGDAHQPAATAFESLTWRLLEQIAQTMDLRLQHSADAGLAELSLEFPRTANHSLQGVSSIDLSDDLGRRAELDAAGRQPRPDPRVAPRHADADPQCHPPHGSVDRSASRRSRKRSTSARRACHTPSFSKAFSRASG